MGRASDYNSACACLNDGPSCTAVLPVTSNYGQWASVYNSA